MQITPRHPGLHPERRQPLMSTREPNRTHAAGDGLGEEVAVRQLLHLLVGERGVRFGALVNRRDGRQSVLQRESLRIGTDRRVLALDGKDEVAETAFSEAVSLYWHSLGRKR